MTHQRMDFALLSMDQLVNNAAKWRFMFGGSCGVPFTVRMILGRGWGQGPTHSQNLQACFAHIPGLKVVMPSTAADAKGLLLASIFDDDPVIFLEHRWLHNITGNVPKGHERVALGKAAIIRSGSDVTVVSMSFMTIEALQAVDQLESLGINCELIDLRTVRPIDYRTIENSISKTGRLLVLDTGSLTGSISGEIVAAMCERCWNKLKEPPKRLAMPDYPEPTSHALTTEFYCDALKIVNAVCSLMNIVNTKSPNSDKLRRTRHDVPGGWFKGPF
jgi:pyruvate dehydrogenase E1 component beta subunit